MIIELLGPDGCPGDWARKYGVVYFESVVFEIPDDIEEDIPFVGIRLIEDGDVLYEDYFVIDRGFNDDPYSGLTYEDAQEEWLFTFYPSTQLTMVIDRPSGYLYLTRGSIPPIDLPYFALSYVDNVFVGYASDDDDDWDWDEPPDWEPDDQL